jgi:hypothetical protein
VAAGGYEGDEGRFEGGVGEVGGGDMAFEVVHRDQGQPPRVGQSLGCGEANEEGADEAGAHRNGDALYFVEPYPGVRECLLHDPVEPFEVGA